MPAEPITRADLDNLAKLFLDTMHQMEERRNARFDERLRHMEERTIERLYDMQNAPVAEFRRWAAPMPTPRRIKR